MVNSKQPPFFNRVEVLVHPFFALENMRIKRKADGLKNMSVKELLEVYQRAGIDANWKREIQRVKKDPNAIMILFGIQELERTKGQEINNFFEGGLTKSSLQKFTKAYQELLHEAKRELGPRLMYVTQGITEQNFGKIINTLIKRQIFPARNVKVNIYGEYLHQKLDACVVGCAQCTKILL